MGERNKRTKLKKSMGPGSIWAVAVGSIIGWGCFIQGGLWTERAGGSLPLFLGFLAGGLLMIVVGYSYSYMIAKFPVAGGEFAYAYKGFGRTASYICGWMLSLGYLSIVALNATALPVLASYIFPGVFNRGYLYTIAGYDVYMGEVGLSLFFIILFGIMNYKGAKSVGNLQLAMVLIMCAAVVVSVIGVIATGHFDASNLQPAYGAEGKSLGSGFVSILALAPFLYVGFDCIPQAAEEYDFPPQKCKMLIISALIVGALIYGAMALVTDCVVPWQQVLTMTDANGTLVKWHTGAVLDLAMGKVGVCFVALAVCMGIFTGMNGFFMTSSRLLFGMARAKMLPPAFEKVHPEHKTPSICVGFTMIICCICPFFGREVIGWVVDMCSVGTAFGYFFTCAGAYILLKKYGDDTDTNKIHPAVAMGGCVISVVILLLLIVPGSPAFMAPQSFAALIVWVLMGVTFYFVSKKNFAKVTKREMDYLILGNVQVVRGLRKGKDQGRVVQGNIVADQSNKS